MEREDQLIKELLKEGFLTKAPDDFTSNVMYAVAETEYEYSTSKEYHFAVYLTIIIGSLTALIGTLYFTNKVFLLKSISLFTGVFTDLIPSFSLLGERFSNLNFQLPYSGLILGIVGIMVLLLAFDKFVLGRNRYLNIFVW